MPALELGQLELAKGKPNATGVMKVSITKADKMGEPSLAKYAKRIYGIMKILATGMLLRLVLNRREELSKRPFRLVK